MDRFLSLLIATARRIRYNPNRSEGMLLVKISKFKNIRVSKEFSVKLIKFKKAGEIFSLEKTIIETVNLYIRITVIRVQKAVNKWLKNSRCLKVTNK